MPSVRVREAAPDDLLAAMNVLDGAGLAADAAAVREAVAAGSVLVAAADDRVIGALVLDPEGPPWDRNCIDGLDGTDGDDPDRSTDDVAHVAAVAVRRRRRDRGVGTALVAAAADRADALTAAFDADVRPFYESLGFAVTGETADGRLRGVRREGGS